jgi:hypothetical protein
MNITINIKASTAEVTIDGKTFTATHETGRTHWTPECEEDCLGGMVADAVLQVVSKVFYAIAAIDGENTPEKTWEHLPDDVAEDVWNEIN